MSSSYGAQSPRHVDHRDCLQFHKDVGARCFEGQIMSAWAKDAGKLEMIRRLCRRSYGSR